MKRLGHRLGLAAWAGSEVASARYLDRLIPLLDAVDSSEAFVRPAQAFRTWATRRRRERAAMATVEGVIGEVLDARRREGRLGTEGDFLDHIHAFLRRPPRCRARNVATARDVILIHSGAQSNLYAALAWTLVNVVSEPAVLARVREGDDELLDQCANESIRLAQRSITLRAVLRPIDVDAEGGPYRLAKGTFVATMLSANNRTAAPGLDRFDLAHYVPRRRSLSPDVPLPAKESCRPSATGATRAPPPASRSPPSGWRCGRSWSGTTSPSATRRSRSVAARSVRSRVRPPRSPWPTSGGDSQRLWSISLAMRAKSTTDVGISPGHVGADDAVGVLAPQGEDAADGDVEAIFVESAVADGGGEPVAEHADLIALRHQHGVGSGADRQRRRRIEAVLGVDRAHPEGIGEGHAVEALGVQQVVGARRGGWPACHPRSPGRWRDRPS